MESGLKNLNPAIFLKNYWQKKPLLLRQAYPDFCNPLSLPEMIRLVGNKAVESRIILEKGGVKPWELRHGPFKKNIFKKLPASHWTLLVQGTNHFVPALQLLLEDFYFIPQWRIEDVMTSYAVKNGNVGAHVDNYDVFLLQAEGRREWRISSKPVWQDNFKPGYEIKLLRQFKMDQRFIVNPGDILYLPPRIPHHGVALSAHCITHSIGFRAPGLHEILDDYLTHVLSVTDTQVRYSDADLKLQKDSGEITDVALAKVIALVRKFIIDPLQLKRWFGQYVTQNKYTAALHSQRTMSAEQIVNHIKDGGILVKNPAARFAYIIDKNKIYFYANGEEYSLPASMLSYVKLLTARTAAWRKQLPLMLKNKKFIALLTILVNSDCFNIFSA